ECFALSVRIAVREREGRLVPVTQRRPPRRCLAPPTREHLGMRFWESLGKAVLDTRAPADDRELAESPRRGTGRRELVRRVGLLCHGVVAAGEPGRLAPRRGGRRAS